MVNTKIRLIIFFAAKDGEALYSQQKQDQELTVTQIMNSLLPNSDLIEESRENREAIQVWPKSNPLWLYSGSDRFKGLDLIDGVPEELWTDVCDTVQAAGINTIPNKKKCKKANGCLRRPYE